MAEEIDSNVAEALREPKKQPVHIDPTPVPTEEPKSTILLWSLAIIVVLIGAIAGVRYLLPPVDKNRVTYNNFEFVNFAGSWVTQWQRGNELYEISLRFNPLETENITIQGRLNDTAKQQPVYITFDPTRPEQKYVALAAAELSLNYARGLQRLIEAACTVNETDACANRSIVTCESRDKAVILLNESAPTSIVLDGNCITIQGKGLELTRAVDRVLYHFFRIQP